MTNPIENWQAFVIAKQTLRDRIRVFDFSVYPGKLYFDNLASICDNLETQISSTSSHDEASRLFIKYVYDGLPAFDKIPANEMSDRFFQICECFDNFLKRFRDIASIVFKVHDTTTNLLKNLERIQKIRQKRDEELDKHKREIERQLAFSKQERLSRLKEQKEFVAEVPPVPILDKNFAKVNRHSPIEKTNLNPNAKEYVPGQYIPEPPRFQTPTVLIPLMDETKPQYTILLSPQARNVKFQPK